MRNAKEIFSILSIGQWVCVWWSDFWGSRWRWDEVWKDWNGTWSDLTPHTEREILLVRDKYRVQQKIWVTLIVESLQCSIRRLFFACFPDVSRINLIYFRLDVLADLQTHRAVFWDSFLFASSSHTMISRERKEIVARRFEMRSAMFFVCTELVFVFGAHFLRLTKKQRSLWVKLIWLISYTQFSMTSTWCCVASTCVGCRRRRFSWLENI